MLEKLILLLTILLPRNEPTYTQEYFTQLQQTPLNIYWISDDNILLSYINSAEIFNLENRQRNVLEECTNCVYGYDKEIIRCEYIHRDIQSTDEYSTTINIYDSRTNQIYTKDIFPTVIPTICTRNYLILKNAYSFLEDKTYLLNLHTDELKEIEKEQRITVWRERMIKLEERYLSVYKRDR